MRARAAAAVLVSLATGLPAASPAQHAPPPERFFDAGGVRVRFLIQGTGPPVLLVHGFAVDARFNWVETGLFDSLARTFTVIAPDLRGHGLSAKPYDPAAYGARFVDDLVGLLDHLGIERAHIVGYSMGAAITLKLVTSHPERVRSAVLGGGGWRPPGEAPPPWMFAWLEGLDRAGREGTSVAEVLRRPDWPPLGPETLAMLDRNDPRALAAALRGAAGTAVTEPELRAATRPLLAVVGELDPARGAVDALARVYPNLTVTIVPQASHVSAPGHPRFLEAVLGFVRVH